ncbi:MAG: Holliday junction resolvase RuvX [Pirellulaceae bacterium]
MSESFPTHGRLAGIDYGTVRIGIAISDVGQQMASPLDNYTRSGEQADVRRFQRLVREEDIRGFVVGLPLHMNGDESVKSQEARQFGAWLESISELPVIFFDERMTSAEAEALLLDVDMSRAKRKKRLDKLAAQIILTNFLQARADGRWPADSAVR